MTNIKPGQQRVRIKNLPFKSDDGKVVAKTYTPREAVKKTVKVNRNALSPKDHNWKIYIANDPLVLQARERLKGYKPSLASVLRGFDGPEVLGRPTPKRTRSK